MALPSAPAGRGCGHSQAQGEGFVPADRFSSQPGGCSQPGTGIFAARPTDAMSPLPAYAYPPLQLPSRRSGEGFS